MAYVNLEGQKGRSAGAFVLQRLDLQLGLAKLAENASASWPYRGMPNAFRGGFREDEGDGHMFGEAAGS